MDDYLYDRRITTKTIAHIDNENTIGIDVDAHVDEEELILGTDNILTSVDYSDSMSVKTLASLATHTADGIYELVINNCDINNPDLSYTTHIELYLSLSSFACEIYMKAIIYFENCHDGKIVRGHNLDELFGMLSTSVQSRIDSKVVNVKSILPAIKNMYVALRYNYEHPCIHGDYLGIFNLMKELHTIAHSFQQIDVGSVVFNKGKVIIE